MTALTLFRQIFLAAMIAGLCAGGATWAVRQITITPLILKAEEFEEAASKNAPHTHDDGWHPGVGLERAAYTLVTDLLAAIAFALLLAAVIQLAGDDLGWWRGMAWGLGGFITFSLAPAISLPPELPGTESGALIARQIWWAATVVLTAAGLLMARFARHPAWYAAAIAAIVLPHLIGAPQPASHGHAAPEELVHRFVVGSLIINSIFWMLLGAITGVLHQRIVGTAEA